MKIVAPLIFTLFCLTAFGQTIVGDFAADMVLGEAQHSLGDPVDYEKHNRVIDEETTRFANQADLCEADLARKETEENLVVKDLPIIRFVAEINANLYTTPQTRRSLFSLQKGVDYDEFGCEALMTRLELPQLSLARSLMSPMATKMNIMCREQSRLHSCFGLAEQVIRDNDIDIYDMDRGSGIPGFRVFEIQEYYPNQFQREAQSTQSQ